MEKEVRESKSVPRQLRKWVLLSLVAVLGATGVQEVFGHQCEEDPVCCALVEDLECVRKNIHKVENNPAALREILENGISNCDIPVMQEALRRGADPVSDGQCKYGSYTLEEWIDTSNCHQKEKEILELIEDARKKFRANR